MTKHSAPNFVVFLTDDHGHWTLPTYGNSEVTSPAFNHLAEAGCVFDQAYCPSPVCSPARASFWTGRMPSAHGIHDWIPEAHDPGTFPHIDHMPGNLVQQLNQSGYQTAACGKYHCNHADRNPLGCDFWVVQETPIKYVNRSRQVWNENGTLREVDGFQAEVVTDAALQFLEQRDPARPFFLFIGHVNTHTPHTGEPEPLVTRYRDATFEDARREDFSPDHGRVRFALKPEVEWREQTAQYYAAVTAIDEQVGRILEHLKQENLLESTHVLYTSDHGHMNGRHGLHTKGNATVPVNFLEESIRVPLIWSGPGVQAGSRSQAMADHCDTHATILDLAGVRPLKQASDGAWFPGRSYRDVLENGRESIKEIQICEYGNARMIRKGNLKLILRYEGPNGKFENELYDLAADPDERTNCIQDPAYSDDIRALTETCEAHFLHYALPDRHGLDVDRLAAMHTTSPWNIDPEAFPVIYQ